MLKLHARLSQRWNEEPFVARISASSHCIVNQPQEFFLLQRVDDKVKQECRYRVGFGPSPQGESILLLPDALRYIEEGDVVRIVPRSGEIAVLYRRKSPFNALLVTERCNSNCLMCSQPPKDLDDSYLLDACLEAISLMDPATSELGITGGEPTLLGDRLLALIDACKLKLPTTAIHLLSNGRLFNYLSYSTALARINHPDLVVGIPIYSDLANQHDFVVQARGAFDQTIRGIVNLKRSNVRVEVRVVLHGQSIPRLSKLARFLTRNLPFVDHVALMGLEMMGHVKMNLSALWVDPFDYKEELLDAATVLYQAGMHVSVYNHQLCVLDRELWPFARKSISDWKNDYLPQCHNCFVKEQCGGFFSSAMLRFSDHITPITS